MMKTAVLVLDLECFTPAIAAAFRRADVKIIGSEAYSSVNCQVVALRISSPHLPDWDNSRGKMRVSAVFTQRRDIAGNDLAVLIEFRIVGEF
jgi:hypothetical protein